ncbi:DUF418 domain-containing protein [Bacillus marinisedimentorum]|uniref:DUF418 domain-containing protein n=1 Tax=Bacillus marinisedimentorum TaxID=1821260 RepID=UPI00147218F8|nr:DUF418 domain-containing protein [Bacillus marinisedimentorum]
MVAKLEGKAQPVGGKERILSLDIIRGFAIFGIFLVNMEDFRAPWLYLDIGQIWDRPADIAVQRFIDIFAQASFYTLFSFLFGYGMIIFMERAEAKGFAASRLFARRLAVLLIIGILHAFFIWHGDILITYSIIGFILILFHKRSARTLALTALAIIAVKVLLIGMMLTAVSMTDSGMEYNVSKHPMVYESIEIYGSGTYGEITSQRIKDWSYVNIAGGAGPVFLFLSLFPMFLLGAAASKICLFQDTEDHHGFLLKIWIAAFAFAIVFKFLPYVIGHSPAADYFQDEIGGPAAALFYASSIVLFTKKKTFSRLMSPFAAVGKMSISNYLLQSVIGTLIFYSYGLGLYGEVGPVPGTILVICIFGLQAAASIWWIKRYRFGPVEWLWRGLTYGSFQRFKRLETEKEG